MLQNVKPTDLQTSPDIRSSSDTVGPNFKLQSVKPTNPQTSPNIKSSDAVDAYVKVSNSNQKFDDISDDAEQAILQSHPLFMAQDLKTSNISKLPTLKLPDTCSKVLIGDSNVQSLYKKKFDSSGQTEIRTLRNASYLKVCNILNSVEEPFLGVRKVAFCLGTVDCNRKYVNFQQIIDDVDNLITMAKKVFPSAIIYLVNVAPQMNPKTNNLIVDLNNKLKHHLRNTDVYFVKSDDLWRHVDDKGKPEKRMLIGNTQLSSPAVDILLHSLREIFTKPKQYGISKSNSNSIISSNATVTMSTEQSQHSQAKHDVTFSDKNHPDSSHYSNDIRHINTTPVPQPHHPYSHVNAASLQNPSQSSTPRMFAHCPSPDPFSMPMGMMLSFFDYIYKSANSNNQSQSIQPLNKSQQQSS